MLKKIVVYPIKARRTLMALCYNKLWKLLIDKNMSKTQLVKAAKISTNAMAKMGKNGDVSTEVLRKICAVLECGIEDIVEIIPDGENP